MSLAASETAGAVLPQWERPFVGRRDEKSELAGLITPGRWVTIVGPPGVGKTRLAVEVARSDVSFDDVVFVDWSSLDSPADALAAVALELRLGRASETTTEIVHAIFERLASTSTLLVLDAGERLAPTLRPLLSEVDLHSSGVLATSRWPFELKAETPWELAPMTTDDAEALLWSLSSERDGDLRGLVETADCLPLALELAAPRLAVLTPGELRKRLREPLGLLGPLETSIRASWDLLTDRQRSVLAQLSVFRGVFDVSAAERVLQIEHADVPDEILALYRCSLIQRADPERRRFRLLSSIREFAAGHRPPGTEARHAAWVMEVGMSIARAQHEGEELQWTYGEIRGDLRAAMASAKDPVLVGRLASAAAKGALMAGAPLPTFDFLEPTAASLAMSSAEEAPGVLAELTHVRSIVLSEFQRSREASDVATELLALSRAHGFARFELGALLTLGNCALVVDEVSNAERWGREALELAREQGETVGRACAHSTLGRSANRRCDVATAREHIEEARRLDLACGNQAMADRNLANLACLETSACRFELAVAHYRAVLASTIEDELLHVRVCANLAEILALLGRDEAADLLVDTRVRAETLGSVASLRTVSLGESVLAHRDGRWDDARRHGRDILRHSEKLGYLDMIADARARLAAVELLDDDVEGGRGCWPTPVSWWPTASRGSVSIWACSMRTATSAKHGRAGGTPSPRSNRRARSRPPKPMRATNRQSS